LLPAANKWYNKSGERKIDGWKLRLDVRLQVPVPIQYKGVLIRVGYRIDMLVQSSVVVELKVVRSLHPVHEAQLLSYLKLSGCKPGLLINFNVTHIRDGIKRMVNNS